MKPKSDELLVRKKNHDIYYFYKGLRIAKPYDFVFKTVAKQRWQDRTVLDVYYDEFSNEIYDEKFWKNEIYSGKIKVNGEKVDENYKFKIGDKVTRSVHKHEFSVVDTDFEFLMVNEDYIVLNKPATVPVHQGGKYSKSSVLSILEYEYGIPKKKQNLLYRLDRLVSGVLIIARKKHLARKRFKEVENKKNVKIYLAKLEGEVQPLKVITVKVRMKSLDKKRGTWGVTYDEDPKGYDTISFFYGIKYDKTTNTSLVLVRIITGKTHQIRIHSKHLGHPVVNDPLYGNGVEEEWKDHGFKYEHIDEDCVDCKRGPVLFKYVEINLHAWRYEFENLKFQTKLPKWCDNFDVNDKIIESCNVKLGTEINRISKENEKKQNEDEKKNVSLI